jgi:hypothetical protein
MVEIWKNIKDYEGHYQVSDLGRVKSLAREDRRGCLIKERILKPSLDEDGYARVCLCKDGSQISHFVHKLVLLTFVLNPHNKPQINHKDGIKINNEVANLEWATAKENMVHKDIILNKNNRGENHGRVKLDETKVKNIRKSSLPPRELAKMYQVSTILIYKIRQNKLWRHL